MGKVKLLGGSQENLNEVLTEQEDIITQIKAILPFKGAGMSEGQYVWKKSKLEQVTITNPSVVMNSGSGKIKVTTTDDIDLSLVDLSFFDGFVSSEPYKFYTQNGQLYFYSTDYPVTAYNTETHELTCNAGISNATFTYTGTKETPKLVFEDYVVADDESAYPDGAVQDGYWYELVEEGLTPEMLGFTKMAIDKFTFSTRTAGNTPLNHSLAELPKFYILMSENNSTTDYDIISASGECGYTGTSTSSYSSTGATRFVRAATPDKVGKGTGGSTTNSDTIIIGESVSKFTAGIEYTLITMA